MRPGDWPRMRCTSSCTSGVEKAGIAGIGGKEKETFLVGLQGPEWSSLKGDYKGLMDLLTAWLMRRKI